jgi:hypothetical protein
MNDFSLNTIQFIDSELKRIRENQKELRKIVSNICEALEKLCKDEETLELEKTNILIKLGLIP